jgi:hypothetical protein
MPQTSTETLPILPPLFAGEPDQPTNPPGSAPPADDDIIIKKPEPTGDEPEGEPAPGDDVIIIK